jgi:8-oxo-dGTP pyrophosphatase MutT (NUDIX family)
MASPSAVAILETPHSFLLEGRPEIPGALSYSGKVQLFGGHIEDGEEPPAAIQRELWQEVDLTIEEVPPVLWSGEVDSQNRAGEPVKRVVNLFRIAVASAAELNLKVLGEIVEIPKTIADIEANRHRLTNFAFQALRKTVNNEWEQQ